MALPSLVVETPSFWELGMENWEWETLTGQA